MRTGLLRIMLVGCLALTLDTPRDWAAVTPQQVPTATVAPPVALLSGQTATLLPNGNWLLLGGQMQSKVSGAVASVSAKTSSISTANYSLVYPRAFHSATLLPDGTVLVTGGYGAGGKLVAAPEIVDPVKGSSHVISSTLLPRAHHCSTLMMDGTVLIVSGVGANAGLVTTAEVWDSRSHSVSVLPAQFSGRSDAMMSAQADGTILIWGGHDADGQSMNSGELYDPTTQVFSVTSVVQASAPDLNLPQIEASLPNDGEENVSPSVLIGLRFSKALAVTTVNSQSATLSGPSGAVPAKVVPAERGMLAFITPSAPLQAGGTYLLTLQGAMDSQGLTLISKTISFTVAGGPPQDQGTSSSQLSTTLSAAKAPPLLAPPGVTALSGQVLQINGRPLANVTLTVGSKKVLSDNLGRFLLQSIDAGHQVLVIEGKTANAGGLSFGLFEAGVQVTSGITNILSYKIWMTPLDTAHAITIPSPTTTDTIITTPALPGLKLDLPPQTVIYDYYGKVVHQITITPIPMDRPPFPIPQGLNITFYFSIQPGGAYLRVGGDKYPRGARLIYPNVHNMLAGTPFSLWNYDPDQKGWFVYGMGHVSPDRTEVIPDPGVSIYEFTGAMDGGGNNGAGSGSSGGTGGNGGDPVDAATGLFNYQHTDAYLPDVIPINAIRTYRQGDPTARAFGIGTTISYDIFPIGDQFPYTYMDLVMPNGGRVHYYRVSSGTSYSDAVFLHTATPTQFYGSTISWDPAININGGGWALHFKDGSVWGFPDSYNASTGAQGSIVFMQDRFGNKLNVVRNWNNSCANGGGQGTICQITSPNGRWLQFTYDNCSRVQQITDDIGRTTSYTYDSNTCNIGHLQTVKDQNGYTTTFGWQGTTIDQMTSVTDGRNIEYLQNFYDSNNRVHQQLLANGGTYTFNYTTDASNNVTQTNITDPNGNVEQLSFGAPEVFENGFQTGGYVLSQTFAMGKPEQQIFTFNLGTQASNPGNFVQSMTDPLGRVTTYGYDSMGNLTSLTRLSGTSGAATTQYTYEPLYNRLASVTDPMNNTTVFTYNDTTNQILVTDPLGNQWTAVQNALGQFTTWKDPAGNTWQFGYTGADLTSVTDPLRNTTTYLYDGAGRRVTKIDPLGEETAFTYDGLNDLLTSTDPLGQVTQYTYDQNRNLTGITDPLHLSNPTKLTYTNMDQIYQWTDPLGNPETYQYDGNGNLTCYTDRKGQTSVLEYDGMNRRISAGFGATNCTSTTFQNTTSYTYDGGNRLKMAVDSISGTVNLNYDGLDDLNYQNAPQGTINYTFDSARRKTSMTVTGQTRVTYGYDASSHLQQIKQGSQTIGLTYDNVGRHSSVALPNGVGVQYYYDADSHISAITYIEGSTMLGNLAYGYDLLGRRSQVTGTYAQMNLPTSVTAAMYNAANELTQWAGTTIANDPNGNLQIDGTNTYTWDLRNQLSSISGGVTASFQYDGLRRRVGKTISGASTGFLYDGWNVVQELSGSTPTANLITGLGTDEIFARTDATGTEYFLTDALGSTIALTNASGNVQTTYAYDPFGNTTAGGTSSTNEFQYTGRENDGTGLYFYRQRYYKPGFGRFTNPDPYVFSQRDTNLFSYAGNDPIDFKDPTGQTKIYGNWCGPNWTGGQPYPYDPNKGPYQPPIPGNGGLDTICMHHDICYYQCREDNPCDPNARQNCMRQVCDEALMNSIEGTGQLGFQNGFWPTVVYDGIMVGNMFPDPGPNGGGSGGQQCSKSNTVE